MNDMFGHFIRLTAFSLELPIKIIVGIPIDEPDPTILSFLGLLLRLPHINHTGCVSKCVVTPQNYPKHMQAKVKDKVLNHQIWIDLVGLLHLPSNRGKQNPANSS